MDSSSPALDRDAVRSPSDNFVGETVQVEEPRLASCSDKCSSAESPVVVEGYVLPLAAENTSRAEDRGQHQQLGAPAASPSRRPEPVQFGLQPQLTACPCCQKLVTTETKLHKGPSAPAHLAKKYSWKDRFQFAGLLAAATVLLPCVPGLLPSLVAVSLDDFMPESAVVHSCPECSGRLGCCPVPPGRKAPHKLKHRKSSSRRGLA